ncbi:hypothetical protein K437DRAFT_226045, partial [Tilletiaria anomala UBC 951]
SEPCVHIRGKDGATIISFVCVVDLLVLGAKKSRIESAKQLRSDFSRTNEPIDFNISIDAYYSAADRTSLLSQAAYPSGVLEKIRHR